MTTREAEEALWNNWVNYSPITRVAPNYNQVYVHTLKLNMVIFQNISFWKNAREYYYIRTENEEGNFHKILIRAGGSSNLLLQSREISTGRMI